MNDSESRPTRGACTHLERGAAAKPRKADPDAVQSACSVGHHEAPPLVDAPAMRDGATDTTVGVSVLALWEYRPDTRANREHYIETHPILFVRQDNPNGGAARCLRR